MKWQPMPASACEPSGTFVDVLCDGADRPGGSADYGVSRIQGDARQGFAQEEREPTGDGQQRGLGKEAPAHRATS